MGASTSSRKVYGYLPALEVGRVKRYMIEYIASEIIESNARIIWNMGVGDGSGLLGGMLCLSEKAVRRLTHFDHVIRISVPSINEGCSSIQEKITKAVTAIADELKIMDEDNTLRKLKNELEEESYFTYELDEEKESKLIEQMKNTIDKKLALKSCLVIIENILQPIFRQTNNWLLDSGLPVPSKYGITNSYWIISTTSHDAYVQNEKDTTLFLQNYMFCPTDLFLREDDYYSRTYNLLVQAVIIEQELLRVAKSILTNPHQNLTTVMNVLWSCLLYTRMYSHNHERNTKEESCCSHCVQPKELVNLWTCEGIFSRFQEVEGQHELESEYSSSVSDEERILRALLSHFLLYKRNSSNSSSSDASCVVPFAGMGELLDEFRKKIRFEIPEQWLPDPVSNFIESILYREWIDESWISFCDFCFQHPFKINPTTTTLILRGCTKLSKFFLETPFSLLKNLRVLDLSYTSIELLPASLSEMTNLRFLSLKGCNQLKTLDIDSSSISNSSPLRPLEQLELLDLGGVSLDTIPNDVGKSKFKLRYLDLSSPSITSLFSFFFQDISNLRELFLLGCILLESLPSSLTNLLNLKTFSLSESQLAYFPQGTFEQMLKLCDLTLTNNQRLRSLPGLVGHANLKSFSLSGSPMITHLSLRACRSLETVYLHDLDQLEELDLSATAIKEFPASLSELRGLKRLDLLALPQLKRLPWRKLQFIPKVFNLDQCECEVTDNHMFVVERCVKESSQNSRDGVGARIFSTDSRLFSSFTYGNCKHLVKEGGPLQSFFISVSSCNKRSKKDEDIGSIDQFKNKKPSYYKDIPLVGSTFKQQFEHRSPSNRHVDISSTERYPAGLEGILDVTESLSVWDDAFVSSLTDLNPKFGELQDCKLGRCHLMESIFDESSYQQGMKLQTLWVSDLQNVKKALRGDFFWDDFHSLKHVHLEHCPRLESIFPGYLTLENLETLTVLHCDNLRTVFSNNEVDDEDQFPRLHTVQLHELPKLSHLFEKQSKPLRMENWKELHFRGCWNLQQLPLLARPRDQKVNVDGEARQCKKLKDGMGQDQLSCYDFKSPPPLASFRERVKNNIFLK